MIEHRPEALAFSCNAMETLTQRKLYSSLNASFIHTLTYSTWSCNATAELRILPQKEGSESLPRRIQHIFYSKENDWGFSHFATWNVSFSASYIAFYSNCVLFQDILDPEKGWVKDDSIILEVWVSADAPHGVR